MIRQMKCDFPALGFGAKAAILVMSSIHMVSPVQGQAALEGESAPEAPSDEAPSDEASPDPAAQVIPIPPPPPPPRRVYIILQPPPPEASLRPEQRGRRISLGTGVLILPPGNGAAEQQLLPTVQFEYERIVSRSEHSESRIHFSLGMFGWGTFRDIYDWFAEGTTRDNEIRLAAGWMIMPMAFTLPVLTPWVSHMNFGGTIVAHSRTETPRLFIGGGAGMSLFRRPTDRVFFLGLSFNATAGMDLTERFGFSLRCIWDPPIVPGIRSEKTNNLFSLSLSMVFRQG